MPILDEAILRDPHPTKSRLSELGEPLIVRPGVKRHTIGYCAGRSQIFDIDK